MSDEECIRMAHNNFPMAHSIDPRTGRCGACHKKLVPTQDDRLEELERVMVELADRNGLHFRIGGEWEQK